MSYRRIVLWYFYSLHFHNSLLLLWANSLQILLLNDELWCLHTGRLLRFIRQSRFHRRVTTDWRRHSPSQRTLADNPVLLRRHNPLDWMEGGNAISTCHRLLLSAGPLQRKRALPLIMPCSNFGAALTVADQIRHLLSWLFELCVNNRWLLLDVPPWLLSLRLLLRLSFLLGHLDNNLGEQRACITVCISWRPRLIVGFVAEDGREDPYST